MNKKYNNKINKQINLIKDLLEDFNIIKRKLVKLITSKNITIALSIGMY